MPVADNSNLVLIHPIGNDRRSWQLLELDSFAHPLVECYRSLGTARHRARRR
jgi:hypothetical protein